MRLRVLSPVSRLVALTILLGLGLTAAPAAQTTFFPYYGKNNIHYDKFDWHIYTTDHFEIYGVTGAKFIRRAGNSVASFRRFQQSRPKFLGVRRSETQRR